MINYEQYTIIKKSLDYFNLNLKGLTIFTELGSNDYLYTSIIAALGGANKVYAIARDSKYGSVEELTKKHHEICKDWKVPNIIEIVKEKAKDFLSDSDIITNSGFVRPLNRETIDMLKQKAVIPLMWETWEHRTEELDLDYAFKKGLLVAGTNEYFLYTNNGFLVTKLLFECGKGVYKDNILVISSGRIGRSISDFFASTKVNHSRIVFDKNYSEKEKKYLIAEENIIHKLSEYDAIVVAEHYHNIDIISKVGIIKTAHLGKLNPRVQIIHICGSINNEDIQEEGIKIYPEKPAGYGYMTISAAHLDSHAVLELNTAGLRVGEIMAKLRKTYSQSEAYKKLKEYNIVDPFRISPNDMNCI